MKKAFFIFIQLCLLQSIYATHNRAGEIYYKRVAPFTANINGVEIDVYTFSITVVRYTDDGMNVANRCMDTIYFGDGTKSAVARANGTMACVCQQQNPSATCGELIVNNPNYIVKKSIYSTIHTYPGPGIYTVKSGDRNRNSGIFNVPNSLNHPLAIEAVIYANSSITLNSSPVLNTAPTGFASNVNCYYHAPNAFDADGDSLSFELTNCRGNDGLPIIGYTYPSYSANGYFFINPYTGLISWCTPVNIGEYSVAFYVREWRKNSNGVPQLIGVIERDMQIIVQAGVLGLGEQNQLNTSGISYPNPFQNTLHVKLNNTSQGPIVVRIFNVSGQLITENSSKNNDLELETSNLPKGLYVLEIIENGESRYQKIIKD